MKRIPQFVLGLTDRLGFRLAVFLSVALLPVGLVAVLQSSDVLREARARAEAALFGETARAAASELQIIQRAQGTAEALAQAAETMLANPDACSEALAELVQGSGVYSFAGFSLPGGLSPCNSSGESVDFSDSELVLNAEVDPRPALGINREAPVSRTSVLFANHPVFDDVGRLEALVWISIPHHALEIVDQDREEAQRMAIVTFDGQGRVLTSSAGLDSADAVLPADRSLGAFVGSAAAAFTGPSIGGGERVFSVVPLIPGELYALGTLPAGRVSTILFEAVPPWVFPGLMWLVSLGVAWTATERLVSRHIRNLRKSITTFAGGGRVVGDLDLSQAPLELREVGEAYLKMTDTILHDEAELEDTLHQKEVLLREVHHRVKNNLQLIASIISMQMRQLNDGEAKELMKNLQDRVISLATIHRGLYQTSGLTDIAADELLQDIVDQILKLATGPGREFDVKTEFDDLRLTPDQAVPLALLMTEVLTNAMKYSKVRDGDTKASLSVRLKRADLDLAVFEVANSVTDAEVTGKGAGLGTQLIQAFTQQLGGHLERQHEGGAYRVQIRFRVRPLSEAEARHSSTAREPAQA